MGRSVGAGSPLTLRCTKCKRLRDWRHDTSYRDMRLRPTGKFRKRHKYTLRIRSIPWPWQAQYECLNCGHLGWTTHLDIETKLNRAKIILPWKGDGDEGNEGSNPTTSNRG
jgi:hypothetical protein